MKRNLKGLGLAIVAVLAMAAMAATTAQAETNSQVTSASSPWTMDGFQTEEHVFTRTGNEVTCETANFHAEGENGDTTITVTPEYKQCHTTGPFGETWPVTVTMNKCDYVFHLFGETRAEPEHGHTFTATADVDCENQGESITIDIYTSHNNHTTDNRLCTLHVPEQNGLTTIDLTNKAAGSSTPVNWIEADLEIDGISSTRTGSFLCGAANDAGGELHGTAALKGTTLGGADNGVTVSTHED